MQALRRRQFGSHYLHLRHIPLTQSPHGQHNMTLDQQKSILTIALLAAFADGNKDDAEREEIRRIAQSLAGDAGMADLPRIYQDVLLRRTSVQAAVQALSDPMHRQLAYEMAVCVCDVDGRQTAAEREFLNSLKAALQLSAPQTDAFDREADAIVDVAEKAVPLSVPVSAPIAFPVATAAAAPSSALDAELDKSILNYALLNGALELLPQSW